MAAPAASRPPTIDLHAADRWAASAPLRAPWLHEEVGRRMEERLQWIRRAPAAWADWGALRGGQEAHRRVAARYPKSRQYLVEDTARRTEAARAVFAPKAWSPRRWLGAPAEFAVPPEGGVEMLWSNMALHLAADPQMLIRDWHRAVATDGFLMFSCLGPDTVRELRALYGALGWPAPSHDYTDMHDWGDMLVAAGFAEPVMDMERIVLTWPTAEAMFAELRELGRNLHRGRFPALRGRGWHRRLLAAAGARLADAAQGGRLSLTFEIIYGHAFKPPPRVALAAQSTVSVGDMRALLRQGRNARPDPGHEPEI